MAPTYSGRLASRAHLTRFVPTRLIAALIGALGMSAMLGFSACTPIGVALGVGATAGVVIAEERSINDAAIDTRISAELNEALFQAHIDNLFRAVTVDVVEGRVMLSGVVKSQELADQAGEMTWKIDGVRQVYNELQIGDGSLVDPARDRLITSKLRSRVLGDSGVLDVNYAFTTAAGVIHIIGIAQNQAEIDRVIGHASDIAHVRRIVNHVVVKTDPSRLLAADD